MLVILKNVAGNFSFKSELPDKNRAEWWNTLIFDASKRQYLLSNDTTPRTRRSTRRQQKQLYTWYIAGNANKVTEIWGMFEFADELTPSTTHAHYFLPAMLVVLKPEPLDCYLILAVRLNPNGTKFMRVSYVAPRFMRRLLKISPLRSRWRDRFISCRWHANNLSRNPSARNVFTIPKISSIRHNSVRRVTGESRTNGPRQRNLRSGNLKISH